MDYFLQVFGEIPIGKAAVVAGAIVFLVAIYKKVAKYFTDKTLADKEKNDRFQEVIDQTKKYPEWHQQSLRIQKEYADTFKALESKLDAANKTLEELKKENSEDRVTNCRYRILRFDDEIRHDEKHTKEHFDQILEDITVYEIYCGDHPDYKNNKAVMAIANIKKIYQKCTDEKTFL